MTRIKQSLTLISLVMLSACGGSGGGDSEGTSISEADFIASLQTGVYRVDTDVDLSGFEFAGVSVSGTVSGSQALSLIVDGSTSVTSDSCGLEPPEVDTNPADGSLFDDDEVDFSDCTQAFSKISETQYRVAFACAGLIPDFSADFIRVSSDPAFDFGSLELNVDAGMSTPVVSDVMVDSGVCGSIASTDTTATSGTTVVDTTNETIVEVVAPYINNRRVIVEFIFSDANLSAGDFTVVSLLTGANQVTMDLSSDAFGGTAQSPVTIAADSGVVTLTSVGERSYIGSFIVNLENGENLSGAFDLSL